MVLHHLLEELQCSGLVTGPGGKDFEDLALVTDSAPLVTALAVDLHKHLVEMPAPVRVCPYPINALPPDLGGAHRAEAVPPEAHGLVANIDPALGQQILDVPKR